MIWLRLGVPVAAFVVAAILLFPMRMAWATAQQDGLSINSVEGTVWSGKLEGVEWRGLSLGDFEAALSPVSLLSQPVLSLSRGSGLLDAVHIHLRNGVTQLSDIMLDVPLSNMSASITDPIALHVRDGSLTMTARGCLEASGRISTDAAPALSLPAFEGSLTCDQGVLTAGFASRDGLHKAVLALTGPRFATVAVREASPEVALVLAGLGIGQTGLTQAAQ